MLRPLSLLSASATVLLALSPLSPAYAGFSQTVLSHTDAPEQAEVQQPAPSPTMANNPAPAVGYGQTMDGLNAAPPGAAPIEPMPMSPSPPMSSAPAPMAFDQQPAGGAAYAAPLQPCLPQQPAPAPKANPNGLAAKVPTIEDLDSVYRKGLAYSERLGGGKGAMRIEQSKKNPKLPRESTIARYKRSPEYKSDVPPAK